MKLVMKADDGKEIVYFNNNDFNIGYLDELGDSLVIDITNTLKIYKDYLEFFMDDSKIDDVSKEMDVEIKKDTFIFKTKKYYFIFENKVTNAIDEISSNLLPYDSEKIVIAYEETDSKAANTWHCFNVGIIKSANKK